MKCLELCPADLLASYMREEGAPSRLLTHMIQHRPETRYARCDQKSLRKHQESNKKVFVKLSFHLEQMLPYSLDTGARDAHPATCCESAHECICHGVWGARFEKSVKVVQYINLRRGEGDEMRYLKGRS